MTTRSGLARIGALLIASLLGVTACGGSVTAASGPVAGTFQDVVAAAEKEGKATIYSSQAPGELATLKTAFEKKYPKITVEVVRAGDADLSPKVEAEKQTGRGIGDVLVSASFPWISANPTYYVKPVGPDFNEAVYAKAAYMPKDSYFLTNAAILTYGWNTKLHPQGLKGYPDVLDPSLAGGKIGIIKPAAQSIVDFYGYLTQNYGADYLQRLAALKPRVYPSSLPMAAALTSGEIAAAIFVPPLVDEKASGAPVDFGLAAKPWGAQYYGMVLGSAPHPNAAQLLADFMVTPDGQAAVARKTAAALPDVPGSVGVATSVRQQDLATLTPDKVSQFQQQFSQLFAS